MTATTTQPTTERAGGGGVRRRRRPGAEGGGGRAGWAVKSVITVICFLWVVPTIGVLVTSFRPLDEVNTSGWWTLLWNGHYWGDLTLHNYRQAISQSHLGTA